VTRLLPVAAGIAVVLVGCGDSGSSTGPSSAPARPPAKTASSTPAATAPKKKATSSYRGAVASCLGDVGYSTRDAGNALRVESAGGRLIANIQTFKTETAAKRFGRGVVVRHATAGQGVAIFLRDAGSSDQSVVTDCLSP
jgi:hypothetical protein